MNIVSLTSSALHTQTEPAGRKAGRKADTWQAPAGTSGTDTGARCGECPLPPCRPCVRFPENAFSRPLGRTTPNLPVRESLRVNATCFRRLARGKRRQSANQQTSAINEHCFSNRRFLAARVPRDRRRRFQFNLKNTDFRDWKTGKQFRLVSWAQTRFLTRKSR